MTRVAILLLSAATLATAPAPAQTYRWDQIEELGVQFRIHKKLKRLPVKLGEGNVHLVARYEPLGAGDYIHGKYGAFPWGLRVLKFGDDTTAAGSSKGAPGVRVGSKKRAANWREYVTMKDPDKQNRKFAVKGKEFKRNKARGDKLPYEWWEFTDAPKMTNGYQSFEQLYYKWAAVYELDGQEVAFVLRVPMKKTRPETKYRRRAAIMLLTVSLMDDAGSDELADEKRDRYADTPEKKKALAEAKANIADMLGRGWDYFTTPSYIVLYSWHPKKPNQQRKQFEEARDLAEKMEMMRENYKELYPPHEDMQNPYPVLRILFSREQFSQYGGTSGGTVGWFSPKTKELVIFTGDKIGGPGFTEAVAFHEGWHQYCDSYFGIELQRWFDEGTGDYFGSYVLNGRRWDYEPSKMRRMTLRRLLNQESWVPFAEIVTWNKSKFYGAKAGDYYAQGYAMIDFFRRGPEKLRRRWDDTWSDVLDTYREVALEEKDAKKAVRAAFAQFKNEDWKRVEQAWVEWVKKEIL